MVNTIHGSRSVRQRFFTKVINERYRFGKNNIPETIKNKGIWKDHIQLLILIGIEVCPQTIKKIAIPLAKSIHSILFTSIANHDLKLIDTPRNTGVLSYLTKNVLHSRRQVLQYIPLALSFRYTLYVYHQVG